MELTERLSASAERELSCGIWGDIWLEGRLKPRAKCYAQSALSSEMHASRFANCEVRISRIAAQTGINGSREANEGLRKDPEVTAQTSAANRSPDIPFDVWRQNQLELWGL